MSMRVATSASFGPSALSGTARRAASLFAGLVLCSGLGLITGCSDSKTGAAKPVDAGIKLGLKPGQLNGLKSVETILSAEKVAAGTPVTVQCIAQPGDLVIPNPTFHVSPDKGTDTALGTLTAKVAGSYNVACFLPNAANTTDPSPSQLLVTAGLATTVTAAVDPAQIASGAVAKVTCVGKDQYGNDAATGEGASWTVSLDKPEVADVTALNLTGKKVGQAAVKCALAGSPDAQSTAATLTVIAGKPTVTVATVTPATFEAGAGQSAVACSATDAAGNAVAVDAGQFTLDVPDGLTLAGTAVTGTKSGTFDVKCNLAGATEQKPGTIVVKPGAPISMTLVAKPKALVYKPDDTIKLTGLGKDKFGNEIADMPLAQATIATTLPEDVTHVSINGGGKSYTFAVDGEYTFTASSTDFPTLSASLKLKVDSTGPNVLITNPKRGETRKGDANVTVTGWALDDLSAIKSFTINKQAVKIGADGSFTFQIASQQGMNAIIWEAKDEWDNTSTGVQAYYYSTSWYVEDFTAPEKAAVKSGIGIWMAQSTLDNGPPHDHLKPKDLASVAEIVIGSLDLKTLVGAAGIPVNQGFAGFTVKDLKLADMKLGDPAVNGGYPDIAIKVIKGGLHFTIKVYKLSMTLKMETSVPFLGDGFQDFIATADWISIETDLFVNLDPTTGKAVSEAKNTKLKIQNLDVTLGANSLGSVVGPLITGVANTLIGIVKSFINGAVTGLIEQVMQSQIQKTLGDTLGSALGALAINQELPLKPFIGTGPEVKLKLSSKLGLLDFQPSGTQQGGILLGLDGSVTSETKVQHPGLGSIGRAGCLEPGAKDVFNPLLKYALEIGLADDFANELLFSVWNGGLMNLTIGADSLGNIDLSQYGVSDVSVTTDFMLPPILNTCIDKQGLLKLQIGDLQIHAKLNFSGTPVDTTIYATMQATAELKAVDNPKTGQKELGFALKGIDYVELEVATINAEAKGLKDLFVTMIKSVMIPKLVDTLGSGLGSFPLPAFDLSAFSKSIPAGTSISLDIQQIDNVKGYTYLRGKVK
jgi:hypothetical protein